MSARSERTWLGARGQFHHFRRIFFAEFEDRGAGGWSIRQAAIFVDHLQQRRAGDQFPSRARAVRLVQEQSCGSTRTRKFSEGIVTFVGGFTKRAEQRDVAQEPARLAANFGAVSLPGGERLPDDVIERMHGQ